jgi:hypothetical protein
MNDSQMRDVSEAVLTSMTEEECANWRHQQLAHIVYHRGRYWEEIRSGFYQPIHWLARLSAKQATRPVQLCWGFRGALHEDEAVAANGSMPVHLLSNIESYDLQNFSSKRRFHIRKCRKLVKIVEVVSPTLLQEQGYKVVLSAITRTAYSKAPAKEDYLKSLAHDYITPRHRLILAGLIDAKLGGYLTAYAVNGTAYIEHVYIATEALPTSIGSGLIFEFVQICRRSKIHEVAYGQHSREDRALCVFKEGMGFPVKHIPTKVCMNPIIGQFIHWYRPHAYYRLTGSN